ncbi:MAG TPA: hypothetical protein VK464_22740 [Symbiobacteriaceae bacterium]|nr:hypothetical protein [Symbiobacteriaceae bacterium]
MPQTRLDTDGFSAAGLWIRRQQGLLSLTAEARDLAELIATWQLNRYMTLDQVQGVYSEISCPGDEPRWVHLLEVAGRRIDRAVPLPTHPLAAVAPGEAVRLLAVVEPEGPFVPGALVETATQRRVLWLRQ